MTGENIKTIRQKQGLTQKQLGELCGIDEANIRKYENGKLEPSLTTIRKIASALGVYIGRLVDDWYIHVDEVGDDFLSYANSYDDFLSGLQRQQKHEENLLLADYRKLNSDGQDEARKRVNELTQIQKYTEIEEPYPSE